MSKSVKTQEIGRCFYYLLCLFVLMLCLFGCAVKQPLLDQLKLKYAEGYIHGKTSEKGDDGRKEYKALKKALEEIE